MGRSQSKVRPEHFEFPPPIQTRDELLQRHADHQANSILGLQLEEQLWFTQMFDSFCTQKGLAKFWSEANLAGFMQSIFPPNPELRLVLMDAIPIMHRCLLRLGSYPYQNDPEEFLTHDVLRTAVILVYHASEEIRSAYLEAGTRAVVLYQSMARLDRGKTQKRKRSADDDKDLKKVLDLLANRRRHPDSPKAMIRGPNHPPASHFPSSWSTDFEQAIPVRDFRSFLRLMLVLNPCCSEIDVDNFAMTLTEVERVTDCILSAFLRPGASVDDDITFDIFNPVIRENTPGLLLGWPRLLEPLICPKPLPDGRFPSSEGLQAFFREAYHLFTSTQGGYPMLGSIFNLPILSQLGFMLPRDIPEDGISVVWSAKADQLHDWTELSCHAAQSALMILLVSGCNSQDEHMTFGLLRDSNLSQKVCSFQLEPVHRAFHFPPMNRESCPVQVESAESGESVMVCRLAAKHQATDLVVDTEGLCHFTFQGPDGHASVDESFRVDAVELLRSD